MAKESILLHACCAPCVTVPYQDLFKDHKVKIYFYNPNIQPEPEYHRRLAELKRYAIKEGIELLEGAYDTEAWQQSVQGLETEPEGGARCTICYRLRLAGTAKAAKKENISWFATTLSVSPHKNSEKINKLGQEIAEQYGLNYYPADFKKQNGFQRSVQISRAQGFYRQQYCGCLYSKKEPGASRE